MTSDEQFKRWKEIVGNDHRIRYAIGNLSGGKDSRIGDRAVKCNISMEEVHRLQESVCDICGKVPSKETPSEIDHDHVCVKCGYYTERPIRSKILCEKCGEWLKVRGSLCRRHNIQLGFLESIMREDNYEKMIEYLKRYV